MELHRSPASLLPSHARRQIAIVLALAAVALGLFARFKGLGQGPLATDEYYIARSVDNILRSGLPEYLCGGYYARGLLYQYCLAGLRLLGLSAELSGRLVSALCSVAVLPAAYLLGRRLQGPTVGWLAVAVLAVSLWEVEMARFARMYAPFQALATWYLVYWVRYTVDGKPHARWPMLALSASSVLIWEGGALLLALNLVPVVLRHREFSAFPQQRIYLAATTVSMILGAIWVSSDWRLVGDPLPPDVEWRVDDFGRAVLAPRNTLLVYPLWTLCGIAPLGAALWAARWILLQPLQWMAKLGLVCTLLAALLHEYAAVITLLLLVSLAGMLDWRMVLQRRAWPYLGALAVIGLFWLAFILSTHAWRNGVPLDGIALLRSATGRFFEFPDFIYDVFRPWAGTAPLLGSALLIALTIAVVHALADGGAQITPERTLLIALLGMAILTGSGVAPAPETRYLFGGYALAIVLAVATIARLARSARPPALGAVIVALASAGFVASEDFRLQHLLEVDQPRFNFRHGMSAQLRSHFYARSDLHTVVQALETLRRPGDVVITSVPALDFYYRGIDFVFIDRINASKLSLWACHRGTVERWGNHPLLYDLDAVAALTARAPRVLLVLYREKRFAHIERRLTAHSPQWLWHTAENDIVILSLATRAS